MSNGNIVPTQRFGSGGGGAWGTITGNIDDQTDLIDRTSHVGDKPSSLKIPDSATASDSYTTAIGSGSTASAISATAIGPTTEATASYSVAIGQSAKALSLGAVAVGYFSKVEESADYSMALGMYGKAVYPAELAVGQNSIRVHGNPYAMPTGVGTFVVLLSPDGSEWQIGVDDSGIVTAVAL